MSDRTANTGVTTKLPDHPARPKSILGWLWLPFAWFGWAAKTTKTTAGQIWARRDGIDTMSANTYVGAIGAWTLSGLGMAYFGQGLTSHITNPLLLLLIMVIYLTVGVTSCFIVAFNDRWDISAAAHLATGFVAGLLMGPAIAQYTTASVGLVMLITAGVTLTMTVLGALLPTTIQGGYGYISGALSTFLWVLILAVIVGNEQILSVVNIFAIILFSGLIVFDFNRALQLPKTHNNAVDSAFGLMLDIFNLFVWLLRLVGIRITRD